MDVLRAARPLPTRGAGCERARALLARVPRMAAVSEDERAALAAVSTWRSLSRGQVLLLEGERSDHLYAVGTGRLKVVLTSDRGDELVLSLLGPGDSLGELSVLDGRARSASVQATVDSEVLVLPGQHVHDLLERSPRLALSWATALAGEVRRLTESQADLVCLDRPRRLAKLLLDAGGPVVELGASQSEVAARLGVARQSLNRALSALQQRGWLQVEGSVVLLRDRTALARFAAS